MTVLHLHNCVGIVTDDRVVTDDNHAYAPVGKLSENPQYLARGLRVEGAGGLIGEQDAVPTRNGSGDTDPLTLTARHLSRASVSKLPNPHPIQPGFPFSIGIISRPAPGTKRKSHILRGSQHRDEIVVLKHHAHRLQSKIGSLIL